jgi:hypothetical protein
MTPGHLTPIEPAGAVEALCQRLATEIPAWAHTVVEEFNAFRETRTLHDGRRLANALRHILKRPDLAAEVEALLPPVPPPPDLAGVLQMQPSGRWAVVMPGGETVEITSGEVFRVEVEGKEGLQPTRMEHAHPGGYYAVEGYPLRDGLRAALGAGDQY